MIQGGGYIDCSKDFPNTLRKTPFYVVSYSLDYVNDDNDRLLIDNLLHKAHLLSLRVNQGKANDSNRHRTTKLIEANCIAGVISEYFWMQYLNSEKKIVQPTLFEDSANQIDLEIIDTKGKIEVRSSFPRNGVRFAICDIHQFRIVGPYSNSYKLGEIQKDFYVGALFHLSNPELIQEKLTNGRFTFYLTGGATWDMMWDSHTSIVKDLIPDGSFEVQIKTTYRVVPYSNALDAKEIKKSILRTISERNVQPFIINQISSEEQFTTYLPLYTIRAACGYFGEGEQVEIEGWINANGIGRLNRNMFVVRASGRSMEPMINDGDYCIFEKYEGGSRNGEIVLAQHRGIADPEDGGSYSIKEYRSEKIITEDSWQHESIKLVPRNPYFSPIEITEDLAADFSIIAIFKGKMFH